MPMEDVREAESPWSTARPDDLRRVADLARRLFAAPAVTITSADHLVRHRSGGDSDELPVRDAFLFIEGAPDQAIGSLRVYGERDWNDDDRAALDDVAACLCSLIESRHQAARGGVATTATPGAPPSPQPLGHEDDGGAGEDEASPDAGARILLADDLDLNRKLISDMLELDGHAVDSVADGEAAVQLAGEHSYDLILMDMIMPVMDGMAATRAIRALPAPACDVPIVALTAYSLPDQLDNCMQAGVDAVLIKPMSVAALNEAIATWSGRRRAA